MGTTMFYDTMLTIIGCTCIPIILLLGILIIIYANQKDSYIMWKDRSDKPDKKEKE